MLLKDQFYRIISDDSAPGSVNLMIELNATHPIFEGHFPGRPVVPGVCWLQIVRELLELATGNPMLLIHATDLKFLAVVDPNKKRIVQVKFQYQADNDETVSVVATIFEGQTVCFKCRMIFQPATRDFLTTI